MTLYYPTTSNFIQKTLNAQLLTGVTASATLNNVTSIQNKAGVMIIDRVDANGVETPNKVEVISFAGTSGSTVTTLVRGLGGTTDADHEVGAIVEFGPDIVWAQGLIDTYLVQHNEDGTHKSATVTTLKASSAEITTGTEDAKLVTPKGLKDAGIVAVTVPSKATAAEVATGTDDAKYTTPLAVAPYANYSMARQAVMNGNFDVWQRGTSVALADVTVTFQADRWFDYNNKDGGTLPTLTRSRQALTAGAIANAFYHTRLATNGAGTSLGVNSQGGMFQRIENGTRLLCGLNKKVTVSFWAKSDITNKRIAPTLQQFYGTGGSPSAAEYILGTPITLTTTWTKYTATFTTNTLASKTFGTANDDYLQLNLFYMWGTTLGNTQVQASVTAETFVGSGNIDIAQVQLCAGDVALPFQPKSEAQEKLDCWRYGFKAGSDTSGYSSIASGNCTATTSASAFIQFPVRMRTAPTTTYPTANTLGVIAAAGTVVALTVIADDVLTDYSARITCTTASGLTAGNATNLVKNNSTSTIFFSAEL